MSPPAFHSFRCGNSSLTLAELCLQEVIHKIEEGSVGDRVASIEGSFGPAASLLLARLVAW